MLGFLLLLLLLLFPIMQVASLVFLYCFVYKLYAQVIHVTGRIRCRPSLVPGSTRSVRRPMGLVALAHTLPPSTLNEVRMESHMFVFRVNMDLQITYCENR